MEIEKKQENSGLEIKEELTEEEKAILVIEEEVGILIDRMHTIEKLFDRENVKKFPFLADDPDLMKKVSFILESLREIEGKINAFKENGEKIVKHNFFQDRIGNFAGIISLSFKRLESLRSDKHDPPSDSPEVSLVKKYVDGLFDYLKELKEDSLLFESEINQSWGEKAA